MNPKITFCHSLRRTIAVYALTLLFIAGKNAHAQVPTITSFSPVSAVPGTNVTLTGTNFNLTNANNVVYFGATRATVTAASATSLTVTVPKGSAYASISVLNTATNLTGFASKPFLPTFTPAKATLTASDFSLAANINGAGVNLYSMTYADLDNDGKPDLITSDNNNKHIYIQPNISTIGTTSFGTMISIDLSTLLGSGQLKQITTGDIDGDGLPEIIVSDASGSSSKVIIIRNTGVLADFTTTTASVFGAGTNANGIAVGDMDNDGRLDVLTGNSSTNSFSVLINNSTPGNISLATKQDFGIGGSPVYLKTADFNNDGKTDVCVTSNNGPTALVFINTSTSTISFDTPIAMGALASIAGINTGDLDNDGNIDLIVCSAAANSISIFKNTTTGTTASFAARQDIAVGARQIVSALGDLNGDGKPDLLTSDYQAFGTAPTYRISVLNNTSNSGNISFGTAIDFAADNLPISSAIIDMDGDGKPDLVSAHTTNHTIFVYRNNTTAPPKISNISQLKGMPGTQIILTGEFNPDPAKNIVYFGATKGIVTASTGTTLTVTVPNGATFGPIQVLDSQSGLSAYSMKYFTPIFSASRPSSLGTNDFTLVGSISSGLPSQVYGMATGDLDNDGKPDLVMANDAIGNGTLYIRKNTSNASTISFGPVIPNVATGANRISSTVITIGDIDGDGKPDLVVPGQDSNNFVVMRNTGTLSAFEPTSFSSAGTGTLGTAIGDFDGDGKIDVVVANGSSTTIAVFRNTSVPNTINFDSGTSFFTGGSVADLVVADFNGDGKPDILASRGTSNLISIFQNTTTGSTISFSITDITVVNHPGPLAVGDIDGDGDLDVVISAADAAGNIGILTNNSTSNIAFTHQSISIGLVSNNVSLGDLNGDGKPDLLVTLTNFSTSTYNLALFTNTSTTNHISLSSRIDLPAQRFPKSSLIADMNGDGKPDLISANQTLATLSIYRNTLQYPPVINSFSSTSAAPGSTITLSGSGFNTTAANNIVYFGPVKATVNAASATSLTVTVPLGATHSLISVLNTASSMIGYSLQKFLPLFSPNKTTLRASDFAAPINVTTVNGAYDVVAADLDGDGKPELLIDDSNNQLAIHQNTSTSGTISFGTRTNLTTNSGARYIAIGDIDTDGKLDIIVPNLVDNNLSIFRNTGSSSISFDNAVNLAVGPAPVTSALADLDGDGKPELIVGNYNDDHISILRNTTTGTTISFDPKLDFTVGTSPVSISAIDIDSDGKLDLVISASGSASGNVVSILRNTGTGNISFAAPFTLATGTSSYPWINAAGDIDGDGKADIVVACSASNNVAIFRNTSTSGALSFDPKITLTTGTNPRGMSLGDMNGDGKLDIVVVNEDGNSLMAFANITSSGTIGFAGSLTLAMPTSSLPRAVTIVDLDGDGKPDIATANGGSATSSIYRNQLITKPVTQTSNLTFTTQTTTSSQLTWTNGSGQKSAVFVKADETTGSAAPVDNTDYTANATFGNGAQIGSSGWFCVYNGTGSSVTLTGLEPATAYRAMVVSLNDNALPNVALYNTTTATGNTLNFTPASTITAITKVDASPTIATIVNYTVTFSNAVTGLSTANFDLSTTGLTGASIASISGSNTSYNIAVNTGTGDGELTIRLANTTGLDHVLTNTLPFTGETYAIDKTAPVFSTSGVPTNATYKTGQNLDFTVTFLEPVTVVTSGGTPTLSLVLNTGGTVQASYYSGTGTTTLTFRYIVAAGDEDTDGVVPGSSIVLNGGTIKDAVGHDADLSVNFPSSATVLVDAIAPVANNITRKTPSNELTNATSLVFHVTFDESVAGIDLTDFSLTKTGTANGSIATVSSASGTAVDVTVNNVSGNGTLRLDLNNAATDIIDGAGNAINNGFTAGEIYTIDQTIPTLSSIAIASANAIPTKAIIGNTITLNFTASETIAAPAVKIAGHTVTATNTTANNWTASYTMASSDPEGNVAFNIAFSDISGNAGVSVATTTNSSVVTFDKTVPTLSPVTIASDNGITSRAKVGNTITLGFTASETIAAPTVMIAGHTVTATNTTANNWTASYTMASSDPEGNVAFNIAFSDISGNAGVSVATTTNSSVVNLDKTIPILPSVVIASDNGITSRAKVGNTITLGFTASETLAAPTVMIAGHTVTATNTTANNWTASYTMASSDPEGNVAFNIAFSDINGNAGVSVAITTNSSAVTFDRTVPALSPISIVSDNAIPTKAMAGNSITLTFTANETITPVVTIASQSVTATHTSGNNWQAVYAVTAASPDGPVSFTIAYADITGNNGTVNSTTDGSNTTISHLSAIATLASLSLNEGTLNPVFNAATLVYSTTVAHAISAVKLTPIASDAAAGVKVNGATVIYGNSSTDLPLAVGNNTLTVEVTSPDGSNLKTYTLTITREPIAVSDISLAATTLLENQPANTLAGTLSAIANDPSATFTYSLVNGSGATDNALFTINGNELRTTASLDFEAKSSYTVRIKSIAQNGLSFEKSFSINLTDVNEAPTIAAIANQSVCSNAATKVINLTGITPGPEAIQTTTLSVSSNNTSLFGSLTVGPVTAGTANLSFTPTPGATGTAIVTVTVTDNGGVANNGTNHSSQSFIVTVNALPSPVITSNLGTVVSKGKTLQLTATGALNYQWSNADGIISGQNTATLTVRPTKTTTYWVTATNATGCSQMASITIQISEDYMAIKPSNILTPNGDGVNDTWVVENIDAYPNNLVKVFDRAGRVLFTKQSYDNKWDGTVNGQRLTEGTYYYIIDFGSQKLKQKGYITLIRD